MDKDYKELFELILDKDEQVLNLANPKCFGGICGAQFGQIF